LKVVSVYVHTSSNSTDIWEAFASRGLEATAELVVYFSTADFFMIQYSLAAYALSCDCCTDSLAVENGLCSKV